MSSDEKRSDCLISCSLDIWGDKWTLLIIRDLVFQGKRTYGDFLESAEGISTNILAARLKMLKENGIIRATGGPGRKGPVGYAVTQKGIDITPILIEIHLWAEKYIEIPDEIREILKVVKADKPAFIEAVAGKLRNEVDDDD